MSKIIFVVSDAPSGVIAVNITRSSEKPESTKDYTPAEVAAHAMETALSLVTGNETDAKKIPGFGDLKRDK